MKARIKIKQWGDIPSVIFVGGWYATTFDWTRKILDLKISYGTQDLPNNYRNACKNISKEEIIEQKLW